MTATQETKDQAGEVISSVYEAGKITVGYTRKIAFPTPEGVYGASTAEASVFVTAETTIGQSSEDRNASIKEAFLVAKGAINEQLGIKFEVDANLVVQEIVEKHFGAVGSGATEAAAESSTPVAPRHQTQGNAGPTKKEDQWAELCANPKKWFDNRATKKGNSPDFKRKQTGEGLWLDFKGTSQVPDGLTVPDPSAF